MIPVSAASPRPEILPDVQEPAKRTIVFAEDDPLVRLATIDMLEDMGFTVWPAADETSAMDLIDAHRPDLLMVDVNLGRSDGRTLAALARARIPELRIIFATGEDPGDLGAGMENTRVLQKPYGFPELRRVFTALYPESGGQGT